ncbi:MAG: FAD-binding protein [Alphaproteobacteria bacterium]|nr:FAD-binding protein [Alphaproteobacteria bacterium]
MPQPRRQSRRRRGSILVVMVDPRATEPSAAEADVVVLGAGLSGSVAAVRAHEQGARVLVVEKMPPDQAGGISRVRYPQIVWAPRREKLAALITYQQALNQPNPLPDAEIAAWAQDMVTQTDWIGARIVEAGLQWQPWDAGVLGWIPGPEFPDMPGADCVDRLYGAGPGSGGLWRAFHTLLGRKRILIRYGARAVELIQDPDTRAVTGVVVEESGRRVAIRARRAVVVATGGFDASPELLRTHMGLGTAYPIGSPANTGDGLRLVQAAGAALWHMRNATITGGIWPAIKVPGIAAAFFAAQNLKVGSYIEIAADHRRFYPEAGGWNRFHNKLRRQGSWVDLPIANVQPVHMILDERVRTQCRLARPIYWNAEMVHRWSADNSIEVAKGWVMRADSIRDLAVKMNRDPDAVAATVERYNGDAAAGHDREFGRDPERLQAIAVPPFYAVALVPGLVGTTGGGRRLPTGHVLDHADRPIPGLFEAGELGSPLANLYENGSFLTEAIRSGRAAGENAAARVA